MKRHCEPSVEGRPHVASPAGIKYESVSVFQARSRSPPVTVPDVTRDCKAYADRLRMMPGFQGTVAVCCKVGMFRCRPQGSRIVWVPCPPRNGWIKCPWHVSMCVEESMHSIRVMSACHLVMTSGGCHACAWRRMAGSPRQGDVLQVKGKGAASIGGEGCVFLLSSTGVTG